MGHKAISTLFLSILLVTAAGAVLNDQAEQKSDVFLIKTDNPSIKSKFDVRYTFPSGFTAMLNENQVENLERRGISVERVPIYSLAKPPGACSPWPDCNKDDSSISVNWVNPTDSETVSGTVTIQINASDSDGDIEKVEWKVDSDDSFRSTNYNNTTGYYEATWNTTTYSEGDHDLTAEATDNDGNTKQTTITVTVDNEEDSTSRSATPSDQTPYGIEQIYNDSTISSTSGGDGIDVAILDTGVYKDHPDLTNRVEQCVDFTSGGPMQTKISEGECEDKNGHGTHTSGTALADAGSDDKGIYGVAPQADLYAYKVCGSNGCYTDDIAAAIDYAGDNGAEVVSMSLGGDSQSSLIRDAIDRNKDQILFVAAAGNDGPDLETMDYPGADPDVVGVAAINNNKKVPDFSSRGKDVSSFDESTHKLVEVAAAGVNVESTWNDGTYNTISGTSMSTPHVSGYAAKYWSTNTSLTPQHVRDHIQSRAGKTNITKGLHATSGYDPAAGIGLPTVS